jgi:gliding motility-associated-like protein
VVAARPLLQVGEHLVQALGADEALPPGGEGQAGGSLADQLLGEQPLLASVTIRPVVITPNGDGINDTWIISNLSAYPGATIDVFNRYGQLVFHSENNSRPWDGTYNGRSLPLATYYYIIDLKNNEKKIAGSVTIFK